MKTEEDNKSTSTWGEISSAENAAHQFNETVKVLSNISRRIWKNRILEFLEVGPEEQARRDFIRHQKYIDDINSYFKDLHDFREEAARKRGLDPSAIDHETLDRAAGRG